MINVFYYVYNLGQYDDELKTKVFNSSIKLNLIEI